MIVDVRIEVGIEYNEGFIGGGVVLERRRGLWL